VTLRHRVSTTANRILRPLDVRVERASTSSWSDQWDQSFRQWIEQAKSKGVDPNDVGDDDWGPDGLRLALEQHYLPFVGPESTVLELGPGSGRLTRHLIGRVHRVVVCDTSAFVCNWMNEYLAGKGRFEVHKLPGPEFPEIADETIDCVFAHGVFEHLDVDQCYWYLKDSFRVLKRGGLAAFNYDSLLAPDVGETLGARTRGRYIFRPHHPAAIERLGEVTGFARIENFSTGTRIDFARMWKAADRPT